MISRLSHAPKIGAALAFGLIATGIAVSESQTWGSPRPALVAPVLDEIGPPMPASLSPSVRSATPVNLAEVGGTVGVPQSGEVPEIALHLLNPATAPDPRAAPLQVATPDSVRMIDMPRRGDALDELGRPVVAPDQHQVAALPTPDSALAANDYPSALDENLFAPIPAPAYRRPIRSYLAPDDFAESPIEPFGVDPTETGSFYAYRAEYLDTNWPRRLDQVISVQGQASVVGAISPDNIFMADWVEVPQNGMRLVVAQ